MRKKVTELLAFFVTAVQLINTPGERLHGKSRGVFQVEEKKILRLGDRRPFNSGRTKR